MKKSKIQSLPASSVSAAINAIETTLTKSDRVTKKLALGVLVSRKLCAASSDKSLKTFLKHAQDTNVGIPKKFADLMGVSATAVAPRATEKPAPPATAKPSPTVGKGKKQQVEVAVSLKGLSLLSVKSGKGKASFPDGSVISVGDVDESALRSNSTVLEFTASA